MSRTVPWAELPKCIKRRKLDEHQNSELSASSLQKQCDDSRTLRVSRVPYHDGLPLKLEAKPS